MSDSTEVATVPPGPYLAASARQETQPIPGALSRPRWPRPVLWALSVTIAILVGPLALVAGIARSDTLTHLTRSVTGTAPAQLHRHHLPGTAESHATASAPPAPASSPAPYPCGALSRRTLLVPATRTGPASEPLAEPAAAGLADAARAGEWHGWPDHHFLDQRTRVWADAPTYLVPCTQFLRSVIEDACRAGVTQFLDLGAGIPDDRCVASIAHQHDPTARVLAVDHDPTVAQRWATSLSTRRFPAGAVSFLQHDLTDPDAVLTQAGRTLDAHEPVCLVLHEVLHFLPGDHREVRRCLSAYQTAVPAGSRLALSHLTADHAGAYQAQQIADLVAASRHLESPLHPRTHAEVTELFGTWIVGTPGVRSLRPGWPADELGAIRWGAVAAKPA